MALLTGALTQVAQFVQSGSSNPSKQPFWDPGGFRPADSAGQGQVTDPNWEAPLSAWSEWDTAFVSTDDGRLRVPGLVSVTVRRKHRTQSKKTAGAHGSNVTLLGFDPAEVEFHMQMWTASQLAAFEALVSSIQRSIYFSMAGPAIPNDKTNPRKVCAFDVQHPALAIYRISSLFFIEGTAPRRTNTPQVFEASLKWNEFSPISQSAAPVTVLGAKGDIQGNTGGVFAGQSKAPAPSPNQSGGSNP